MDQIASWIATVATIAAACFTASNLGSRVTGIGFIIFTVGSIAWFTTGLLTGQPALMWTNVAMTLLNAFGVWRWLGRQAKLEDGASKAAEKSADEPGEDLFAASSLTSAKLLGRGGQPLGSTVDAMLSCDGGKLAYLVVAKGGVAGVGETFRRVDWHYAGVQEGAVHTDMTPRDFERLPELQKDNWPGA
ncbi:PRC-barrel domain-containing protein [Sphingomonas astaxanthinifaciens]|uniref:Photosystem reaction center subunit H n=1 Tax=Sphingomonas astaxanthinifaciens DSM 22298 TaxID=1123267 RepID=A0ABQ5Z9I7_9SPHN|nr:PRC-barrel domain-containing protein [Sphingomonas astaxanthinifaciens]GLR48602.1 photosystem reaction center subunit H [Sphingomonas astaxanthinifaciens DSM 22298]